MFVRSLRPLLLTVALTGLVACGGSTEPEAPADSPSQAAPAPAATPEAPAARADSVVLDPALSTVTWTSIKNGDAPVAGTFTKVSGGLALTAADLSATTGTFTFDLSGVDSGLELRDQRISEVFFEAAPDAAKTATVTLTKLVVDAAQLEPGSSTTGTADMTLAVSQGSAAVQAHVAIKRTDENTWTVVTHEDATVSIKSLGLGTTLDALMTLCAHNSVDDGVAIGLNLTFKAAE